MSHVVEIRLPRQVTVALGKLDDERLAEVKQVLAEAEKRGQGLIIAEHKHMKVVEVAGMTTGRIVAELRLIMAGDPVTTLAGTSRRRPRASPCSA
jgi:ABC-type lipopolysaccharide export system ATPase subunit